MRGNSLKIKSLEATYKNKADRGKPCWYDSDTAILHSCFQILVDFMEGEEPGKRVDWSEEPWKSAWRDMQILYKYWKVERFKLEKEIDLTRSAWHKKHKTTTIPEYGDGGKVIRWAHVQLKTDEVLWKKLHRLEKEFQELENEMLLKLVKVRGHMWT